MDAEELAHLARLFSAQAGEAALASERAAALWRVAVQSAANFAKAAGQAGRAVDAPALPGSVAPAAAGASAASAVAAAAPAVARAAGAHASAALAVPPGAARPALLQTAPTLAFAASSSGEAAFPHSSPAACDAGARGAGVAATREVLQKAPPPAKAVPSYREYWVRAGAPGPFGPDLRRQAGENARDYLEKLVRYHVGDRFDARWIQYDAMPSLTGHVARATFSDVIGGGSYWGHACRNEGEAANASAEAALLCLVHMPDEQLPRFVPTAVSAKELA